MRNKWGWAVALLLFAGGCEVYLGVAPHKLWECPMVAEACVCGDNQLSTDIGEECDDGNAEGADGCSSSCKHEFVTSIVAGAFHSCALFSGGAVKCWGRNDFGQLGIGDRTHRGDEPNEMGEHLPAVSLGKGRYATALAAGAFHTCALLDDGSVKCWGLNGIGQLGLGDVKNRGDEPNEMGDALPTVAVGKGRTVVAIAAGAYHTCVLLSDNGVTCWGANASGQLGFGDAMPRGREANEMGDALPTVDLGIGVSASSISAGDYFTCAVLAHGLVKCWGENRMGQLGQGDALDRGDQPNDMGDNLYAIELGGGNGVESVSLGNSHICALSMTGAIKCWGGNGQGQLGLGNVMTCGNAMGQMGEALPFVSVGMGTVSRVVAGYSHTCVVMADWVVKCWGGNQDGQLGVGHSYNRGDQPGEMGNVLLRVELGSAATMVAAGDTHTCALLDDGSVKCWGGNAYGQIGIGDTNGWGDDFGETLLSVKLFSSEAAELP